MTINGKEVKFLWGSVAFEVYQEAVMKSKRKFNALSVTSISAILWGGILNHYERLFEEPPFEYSEIYDYIIAVAKKGEVDKEITDCITAFNASIKIEDTGEADEKKSSAQLSLEPQLTKQD